MSFRTSDCPNSPLVWSCFLSVKGRLKAIGGYFASDTEYSFENFLTDYHSHSPHSPQRGWSILDGVATRKPLVHRIYNTLYVSFLESIALKCLLIIKKTC